MTGELLLFWAGMAKALEMMNECYNIVVVVKVAISD
jgi:hypothetical protein